MGRASLNGNTVKRTKSLVILDVVETSSIDSDYIKSEIRSKAAKSHRSKPSYGTWLQFVAANCDRRPKRRTSQTDSNVIPVIQEIPHVALSQRTNERLRLAYTYCRSTLRDFKLSYQPISASHSFSRRIVEPLFTWEGKNARVITGRCLGSTTIEGCANQCQDVIHAASQNYVGFNRATPLSEELQRLALDSLSITERSSQSVLAEAVQTTVADFLQTDFCFMTSTGYGSNLLAFPAILDPEWLVVLDSKSHNSMHVGAYLSNAGKILKVRHNDMAHLEELLLNHRSNFKHILVAVEGLYSMDGTIAPLAKLNDLKHRFNFILLVDEAHSLLTIGKTGRGCLEFWNDIYPGAKVPDDLIDIRTATLSKSFSAIGGIVCGKAMFGAAVAARQKHLLMNGADSMLTAAMVQCLRILQQPDFVAQRLQRSRQIASYARDQLKRAGLYIYGDAESPILPIHAGRPSLAAKFSYGLRKNGVLATPVSTPAVPFWQSRIRVCLSADHTDKEVTTLIEAIIDAAFKVGIIGDGQLPPTIFPAVQQEYLSDAPAPQQIEDTAVFGHIKELIQQDTGTEHNERLDPCTIQAGHLSRQKFGLCSGGARWISGTFSVHIQVEKLITEIVNIPDSLTLTYPDNYLGKISTVAALCRSVFGHRKHSMLLPVGVPPVILDGIKVAPKKTVPNICYYESLSDLADRVARAVSTQQQVTLYLETSQLDPELVENFTNKHKFGDLSKNLTILLCDTTKQMKTRAGRQALHELATSLHRLTRNLLVYGSFMDSFGAPGAYLTGSHQLVEELRYSSRGYMFTTSPLPFVMGMVQEQLRNPLA